MDCSTLIVTSSATATLSALAAAFSAVTAYRSFQLARLIQNDLKSDERIVVGAAVHPNLRVRDNANAVIHISLFNKSKRKAYISAVSVFDRAGSPIAVTWSDEIDELGNPLHPSELTGIIDSVSLYIRRNDGKVFEYARILLEHSFSERREVVIFDEYSKFVEGSN